MMDWLQSAFVNENLMGPNSIKILEELCKDLTIHPGMRVLDLGCGRGLTSIFLAKEFGARVFACDLWISATDNEQRFREFGLSEQIIPLHLDATSLPFANDYFDLIVSVDAFHYFGIQEDFIGNSIIPLVKEGGQIGIACPGLKQEFLGSIPRELQPYVKDDMNFHSCAWWQGLWERTLRTEILSCRDLPCFASAWNDWLSCKNSYAEFAKDDALMLEADAGRYLSLISLVARRCS